MAARPHLVKKQTTSFFEKLEKALNQEKYLFLKEVDDVCESSAASYVAKILSILLYEKDPLLFRHDRRIMKLSFLTMEEMVGTRQLSPPPSFKEDLFLASLFHDLGKIVFDKTLIMKKGPLTDQEWSELKWHSVIGSNMFNTLGEFQEVSRAIRHHHERYDGTGYPDGLKGEEIPLVSRIIAIGDAYDSMTTERHYQKKVSSTAALKELVHCSLTQFDPKIVSCFVEIIKGGEGLKACRKK